MAGKMTAGLAPDCWVYGYRRLWVGCLATMIRSESFGQSTSMRLHLAGFPRLLESPGLFPKISRTWKVLENEFGPRKSWKLEFEVLLFTRGLT